jgi:hypothetical protein
MDAGIVRNDLAIAAGTAREWMQSNQAVSSSAIEDDGFIPVPIQQEQLV